MQRSALLRSTQSVVAAMTRAARRTTKGTEAEASDADSTALAAAAPRYLLPALQTFAQQRSMREQHLREDQLPASATFMSFIEVAHAASVASLKQLQRFVDEQANSEHEVAASRVECCREVGKKREKCAFAPRQYATMTALQQRASSGASAPRDRLPDGAEHTASLHEELAAAVRAYDPTLEAPLIQRIASRLAISDTLRLASQLVQYLRDAAAAEEHGSAASLGNETYAEPSVSSAKAMELLQRAMGACRARYNATSPDPRVASHVPWVVTTTAVRERAGVAIRFHNTAATLVAHGQRRRRPLPRCFFHDVSDVQVSEVLPSGAVVVFTHPTQPAEVGDRAGSAHVHGEASGKWQRKPSRKALRTFRESLEACLASSPAEVHLHGVLFRRGESMAAATATLVDAAEGHIQHDDVHVNVAVPDDGECVVVQMCSIRVRIPGTLREQGCGEEAVQHCLHVARTLASVNTASGEGAGGREGGPEGEPRIGLQLLYCRPHACAAPRHLASSAGSATPQLQYALLLRGFDHRGGPADQLDRTALLCSETIPNFFAPSRFGPAAVPFFRTYHVTAALDKGRYAEAAAMLLCLESGAAAASVNGVTASPLPAAWLEQALRLLCNGEEREGVWQAWWKQHVPADVQAGVMAAKAELVWNVLASCRLQQLAAATNGRGDALQAATPDPGDFVLDDQSTTAREEESADSAAAENTRTKTSVPREAQVVPVFCRAQAARYAFHDIALPVVCDAASSTAGCESVAALEAQLGFATPQRRRRLSPQASLTFRPLFIRATGHPRAARPWARSFQEPVSAAALDNSPTVFSLATDWELAGSNGQERDYAAKSRGPRAQVWPLSKRGRALSDRLPVGLLAVASANGSSLLSNDVRASRCRASRCLAVHCTLPADVSVGNYLGEFTALEDLRQA